MFACLYVLLIPTFCRIVFKNAIFCMYEGMKFVLISLFFHGTRMIPNQTSSQGASVCCVMHHYKVNWLVEGVYFPHRIVCGSDTPFTTLVLSS
jgi:hypothetical protein